MDELHKKRGGNICNQMNFKDNSRNSIDNERVM